MSYDVELVEDEECEHFRVECSCGYVSDWYWSDEVAERARATHARSHGEGRLRETMNELLPASIVALDLHDGPWRLYSFHIHFGIVRSEGRGLVSSAHHPELDTVTLELDNRAGHGIVGATFRRTRDGGWICPEMGLGVDDVVMQAIVNGSVLD